MKLVSRSSRAPSAMNCGSRMVAATAWRSVRATRASRPVGARAGRTDLEGCPRDHVGQRCSRAWLAQIEAGHLLVHAAEPQELGGIEPGLRGTAAQQRLHGHAAADDRDFAAVPGSGIEK